jgi:hypothetical protein
MKTWMEERDLFIAQTMMFVNEIVASTPAQAPASPQSIAVPILLKVEQPQTVAVPIDRKVEQAIRGAPEVPVEPVARVTPLPIVDERAEIAKRVAAFKAHQARFSQERDTFFRSMMTKIDSQRPSAKLRSD